MRKISQAYKFVREVEKLIDNYELSATKEYFHNKSKYRPSKKEVFDKFIYEYKSDSLAASKAYTTAKEKKYIKEPEGDVVELEIIDAGDRMLDTDTIPFTKRQFRTGYWRAQLSNEKIFFFLLFTVFGALLTFIYR